MSETSPLIPRALPFGRPSVMERIKMFFILLPLPIVLLWTLLFQRKGRGLRRTVLIRSTRYLITSLSVRQLQHLLGPTADIYAKWAKTAKVDPIVEPVVEGGEEVTKLLWIGERALDKVIIYLHGGGFMIPPPDINLNLLYHIRTRLRDRGINVGVVVVQYSVVPEAAFPTPLRQAVAAINHLMDLGVDPQNMQFVGDSAGGNLILQVLGHLIHPLEFGRVPPLSLPAPLKGVYLMSPWVDLADLFKTFESGNATDTLSPALIKDWGSKVLAGVPPKYLDYAEANSAKEDWWKGVDAFVDRVLITVGKDECLKSEIIRFGEKFNDFHSNVKLVKHSGVHNDPIIQYACGETSEGTPDLIIDWLAAGFQDTTAQC